VVALEKEGTWAAFVAVESTARDSGYLLVIDDGLSIQYHGNEPSEEGDICGIPFVGGKNRVLGWSEEPIDRGVYEKLSGVP